MQAILRDHPQDSAAHYRLGLVAHQLGHADQASKLIARAVALAPQDGVAWNSLGQLHASAQAWSEAAQCFERAVALRTTDTDALNNLANVRRRQGRSDEALALYRRVVALRPSAAHAHYNLGRLLHDRRAYGEAVTALERAAALDPGNHRAHYQLGVSLEEHGRFAHAAESYLAALRLRPDHAPALANLLALRIDGVDPAIVAAAEHAARSDTATNEERSRLLTALGKYFDRAGEVDRAFGLFRAANDVQRQAQEPPSPATVQARTAATIHQFGRDHFARVQGEGHPSNVPIFIVGLPRSGTTLVEQILASHPNVFGGGELMQIPRLAAGGGAWDDPDRIADGAERYLRHLASFAPADQPRVTDKLPVNYRHLGLIATLFPHASIVHCRRDPRDVALSCFVEMIALAEDDYASLPGIYEAIVAEAALMAHWRQVLPSPIVEVRYESLIADQVSETERLLAACGLAYDERCLSFFDTARSVDTPSRWQVRQPIYTTSRQRWRRYAKHLQPLLDRLEQAGLAPVD